MTTRAVEFLKSLMREARRHPVETLQRLEQEVFLDAIACSRVYHDMQYHYIRREP